MQKRIEQIVKDLSAKYNLPEYVIEEVITSQFKFVKEMIKTSNKTVMLSGFGKFTPSLKKLYYKKLHTDAKAKTDPIPQSN